MAPQAGQIYWAYDDGENDPHLVIVVSKEEFNRGTYLVVVTVTSKKYEIRSKLPNCVPFRAGQFCFTSDCCAQAESIGAIEKHDVRIELGPAGALDENRMRDLIRAIGYVIDAECEPT